MFKPYLVAGLLLSLTWVLSIPMASASVDFCNDTGEDLYLDSSHADILSLHFPDGRFLKGQCLHPKDSDYFEYTLFTLMSEYGYPNLLLCSYTGSGQMDCQDDVRIEIAFYGIYPQDGVTKVGLAFNVIDVGYHMRYQGSNLAPSKVGAIDTYIPTALVQNQDYTQLDPFPTGRLSLSKA